MKKKKVEKAICSEELSHSTIKVEENNRKAIFKNENREVFIKTRVDGCLVSDGAKCDYLLSKPNVASILIELKGKDVHHACEQLISSAEHENVKPLLEKKIGFLIICSKFPKFDYSVAKAKSVCSKKYKAGFHVVCDQREFDIERVAAINGPY